MSSFIILHIQKYENTCRRYAERNHEQLVALSQQRSELGQKFTYNQNREIKECAKQNKQANNTEVNVDSSEYLLGTMVITDELPGTDKTEEQLEKLEKPYDTRENLSSIRKKLKSRTSPFPLAKKKGRSLPFLWRNLSVKVINKHHIAGQKTGPQGSGVQKNANAKPSCEKVTATVPATASYTAAQKLQLKSQVPYCENFFLSCPCYISHICLFVKVKVCFADSSLSFACSGRELVGCCDESSNFKVTNFPFSF